MTIRGIAHGKIVELEGGASLPDGTPVEVSVAAPPTPECGPSGFPKGSPEAIRHWLMSPPLCTPEDVDALMEEIRRSKRPSTPGGVFDDLRTRVEITEGI